MRRLLTGMTAIAASIGWLHVAPAFGFPVAAPSAMFDRMLGADREAGFAGVGMLLLGEAALVGLYFVLVEPRTRRSTASIGFAIGVWLLAGAAVMPLVGLIQGAPPPGDYAGNPMRANFFMLNLGIGAAAEALVGWLVFTGVLAAGATLKVSRTAFSVAVGGALVAGAIALVLPTLLASTPAGRVVEARVGALPAGDVFISVLELPQPPGAVLGPHQHIAGFVADVSGIATLTIGGGVADVRPGDAFFTADQQPHDHENRAAVPAALTLALVLVGSTVALLWRRGRSGAVGLVTVLLVAGTVASIDPLMNHWYFVAVRPVAQRGVVMPVPDGHRTYESLNLTGLASGQQLERLTDRRIEPGESARVAGPAAVVVLDGHVAVTVNGKQTELSARSGTTIPGGTEAAVTSDSGARVLVFQVLPAN